MEQEACKRAAGYKAAEYIQNGMLVGIGTGSTVYYFIERLAGRIKEGLKIQAASSSNDSSEHAKKCGIPLININTVTHLDLTIDGADEIDHEKRMIKGGGGALLREKILASMSKEMIVIIDESKLSSQLGRQKLPVEIVPFACEVTLKKMQKLGYKAAFRKTSNGALYVTDNGNYIADIHFPTTLSHPEKDDEALQKIPGVVETGFFFQLAGRVIIGFSDGQVLVK